MRIIVLMPAEAITGQAAAEALALAAAVAPVALIVNRHAIRSRWHGVAASPLTERLGEHVLERRNARPQVADLDAVLRGQREDRAC